MIWWLLACAPQLQPGVLPACGRAPNCVSSLADADDSHHTPPLRQATVDELEAAVHNVPGCVVGQRAENGLVAACTTPMGLYTDDLVLRVDDGAVQVYSASRVGWSDMGVNRERVEALRHALK